MAGLSEMIGVDAATLATAALVGLVLLLCLALAGLGWVIRARAAERAAAEAEGRRLDEILMSAPDGFYRWDHGGGEHCSRRLAVMLGLFGGIESTYAEVLESFGIAEAAVLEVAVAGLRQNGLGFELELALRDGVRQLHVVGQRISDAAGEPLADVLWMRDVSEGSATVEKLSAETEDLKSENIRLRGILDAIDQPVWLRDDDLSIIYCNQAYARAVDRPTPEAAVEAGAELVPGSAVREARALAARSRAANTARSDPFHLVIGGERRLLMLTEVPLPAGPLGTGLLTAGYAVDQTRQEELFDELARHNAAHSEVLERLSTAIAIFGTDTRLGFHNTAFRHLWDLEQDWLESGPTFGAILDVLRERRRLPEVVDYRAYKEEELRRFTQLIDAREDLLHLPDGSTLRRVVTAHPFGGLLFTYEDVTDVLALERGYNTSLAVLRETLDNLHEGVAVFGPDRRLRLSNPAFAGQWALGELEGEPAAAELIERMAASIRPEVWPGVRDTVLALFEERTPRHGRLERSDGAILDYSSVPLPDGGVLTTWLDVSDPAHVERALRERNEALRDADRLKSDFIANVSSEVRTPLTTIIGFAEMLAEQYFGPLNKRQQEYAQGILEAGNGLNRLVHDILDLAGIEAGQVSLELDAFDVHALLAGVLSLTRERMREKKLTMNFDCPLDIGWMVGDQRRLKQVLFNLVGNAIKFTPSGGQITLAAQRDQNEVVFTVADTGIGIPAGQQAQMLESFVRGDRPEARQDGAGLGLTLVKRFVELHGGRLELVSVPGEGTTVTVRIPAGGVEAAA